MSLSHKAQTFADSKGKFHEDQHKADTASAQYILDAANPRGALSVQALVTLMSENPDFNQYITDEVSKKGIETNNSRTDNTVNESGTQGGTNDGGSAGAARQPHSPASPGKRHTH